MIPLSARCQSRHIKHSIVDQETMPSVSDIGDSPVAEDGVLHSYCIFERLTTSLLANTDNSLHHANHTEKKLDAVQYLYIGNYSVHYVCALSTQQDDVPRVALSLIPISVCHRFVLVWATAT